MPLATWHQPRIVHMVETEVIWSKSVQFTLTQIVISVTRSYMIMLCCTQRIYLVPLQLQ